MKRIYSAMLIVLIIVLSVLPCNARLIYSPPYPEVENSRLISNMPEPFSVDTVPVQLLGEADFNNGGGTDTLILAGNNPGKFENGVLKIEKMNTDSVSAVQFVYRGINVFPGESYAFSCKIKTEGVEGGAPRSILSAYNNGGWLDESSGYDGKNDVRGDTDWYEMTQLLSAPDGTTFLNVMAYLTKELTGTVYFDDFKLYRLIAPPLESVLCQPNYKGLIYGDGIADIKIDAIISDRAGFYNLSDMSLEVLLVDENGKIYREAYADTVHPEMNFVFSSAGLEERTYYIQNILKSKSDKSIISKKEHTIRKKNSQYRPNVYLDKNGHIIENGEKKFLKRIYTYRKYMGEVANNISGSGIDTLSNYDIWWGYPSEFTSDFEILLNKNMQQHINLVPYRVGDFSTNYGLDMLRDKYDILPFFTQVANDYKDNPIFEGYYIFDEPNPVYIGEEIRWNNEILADADINHPTFGVASRYFDIYGIYTKMADIVGVDPYPVFGNENDDLAEVGRAVKNLKKNHPERPVYVVLQGFDKATAGSYSYTSRSPIYEELRNMAWQAICEGAEGLDIYAYPDMIADPTKELETWIDEIKLLYNEIGNYEEVLLSDEPIPLYEVKNGGDWLNLLVKRYNEKTYIFAANNTKNPHSFDIEINGAGTYHIELDGLGVYVNDVEHNDYLSSEAELISMGFSDGTETFPVAVQTENILYVSEDEDVINYNAEISEGAKLYLNNVERELSGKITINNSAYIIIKVLAEDGITFTEKTYFIERN